MDEPGGRRRFRSVVPMKHGLMIFHPHAYHPFQPYRSYAEKRFICPMYDCRKRYSDPSSLRKHLKGLHGESSYTVFRELKNAVKVWEKHFRIQTDVEGNAYIVGFNGEKINFDDIPHVSDLPDSDVQNPGEFINAEVKNPVFDEQLHFPIQPTTSVDQFLFNEGVDRFNGSPYRNEPDKYSWFSPSQPAPTSKFAWDHPVLNSTPPMDRRSSAHGFDFAGMSSCEPSQIIEQSNEPSQVIEESNELFDALKRRDQCYGEQEKYESFLYDEIMRRPHVVKKIIAMDMENEQFCLSPEKDEDELSSV